MPHKRAKRSIRDQLNSNKKSDLPPSQPVFTPSDIPKSMARILNAEAVQNAFRTRRKAGLVEGGKANSGDNKRVAGNKRKRGVEEEDKSKQELKIKPGESLAHFRRRVDDNLRTTITSAMKSTASTSKQKLKESQANSLLLSAKKSGKRKGGDRGDDGNDSDTGREHASASARRRETSPDFVRHSSSAPKRLNDIVQAPPELKGVPRLTRLAEKSKQASKTYKKETSEGDDDDSNSILTVQQKRMMELEREKAINRYRALKEARLKERSRTIGST